ncbi:MAG: ATP-binding protein [Candidatus Marsarchaeota archaeon]|nr:ATP-binding protein [Candidatus Marsarchaeota archaeon]
MLFDINPKEKVSDLYDRKKELKSLSQAIKNDERLSIVFGVRRIGKTSLIHAFLSGYEVPYVLVDARKIYTEHAAIPISALYQLIGVEFLNFVERLNLDSAESMKERYPKLASGKGLTDLLTVINEWCGDKKLKYAIVLDEAQYLRFGGSVKYDMLIAWSMDNLPNIMYILTGSEVGMLKDFLNYEDINAPLYGRYRNEIYLGRFDAKTSEHFLSSGFKEVNAKISSGEIKDIVKELGGVVGWLTYYGHFRGVRHMGRNEALKGVFDEGSKIVTKEIEGLISRSRGRYLSLLKSLSNGPASWAEIKSYAITKTGVISDSRLNALLQNLLKFGIIEKTKEKRYIIIDPITMEAIKKLKP